MNRQKKILWLKIITAILVLFSITFLAYKEALQGGMAWDAGSYLMDNPYITAFSWENIKWMFSTFYLSNWHPLTWLSYAMDYVIYGTFWGVALTNIILHCANTVLIFIFTLTLINANNDWDNPVLNQEKDNKNLLAAFVAALLFGLHPQHVESVAWLAERKDVLCQFFVLLTFIFYIGYAGADGKRQRNYYSAALVCFALALLSKPMAVTVPVLLIIGDFYPLKRISIEELRWSQLKKILIEKIPFLALSLMLMLVTLIAQTAAIAPLEKFDLQIRVLNAFKSTIVYVSKLLFPVNLLPLYDEFPDPADPASLVPIAAFLVITVLFSLLWFRQQKYWLAVWLFYLISLLPVVGIVQVGLQSSADRYAYLPTVPLYILMGCGFATFFFWMKNIYLRVTAVVGLVVITILLFTITGNQITIWKSDFFLWKYITKILPDHGPAHTSLGAVYFNQGNYEKAVEHYEKAGVLGKTFVVALPAWALSYLRLGKLDQALQIYKIILERKQDVKIPISCIHYNIGLIYARQALVDQAKEFLLQVNLDSPEEFFIAHQLLSMIENNELAVIKKGVKIFSAYRYCEQYQIYTAARYNKR